jgi:hypothetical protein
LPNTHFAFPGFPHFAKPLYRFETAIRATAQWRMNHFGGPVSVRRRALIKNAITSLLAVRIAARVLPGLAATSLSHLDESEEIAASLGYRNDSTQVDASKFPQHQTGQVCAACRYFQGNGDEWGPCVIFAGKAVHSKGWCSAFAAK